MDERVRWDDARRLAYAAAPGPVLEWVPVAEAAGRTLAADLRAGIDVPHYPSSAMDGWAVAGAEPWILVDGGPLTPGSATGVATGGLIPGGTLGVLRHEYGAVRDGVLHRSPDAPDTEPGPGTHVRPVAREAQAGDVLLGAGTTLTPVALAVAVTGLHDTLPVARRPRVALLHTGDEVITSGTPGPGQVRDSLGVLLATLVTQLGGEIVSAATVPDDAGATRVALTGTDADLVLTTGGTGLSGVDLVRPALTALAAEPVVPRLATRPGGPALLARPPGGPLVVGLPGNPLAAVTAALLLAAPALAAMLGSGLAEPGRVRAGEAVAGRAGADLLLPCTLPPAVRGAVPTAWTGSGMLRGLVHADVLAVVPSVGAAVGDELDALPLPWR
ncbi:molybdopterin molybdotransferase MoeA [Spongisporangium articulatum]|uniref:Molybdopterin molybdenumtransferase n=1 Tax=Spongisporangium articulatum TaxID=3362603 RepID=A0ABW8ALB2_9ACTN